MIKKPISTSRVCSGPSHMIVIVPSDPKELPTQTITSYRIKYTLSILTPSLTLSFKPAVHQLVRFCLHIAVRIHLRLQILALSIWLSNMQGFRQLDITARSILCSALLFIQGAVGLEVRITKAARITYLLVRVLVDQTCRVL